MLHSWWLEILFTIGYDGYVSQMGMTVKNNIALNNGGAGYAWLSGSCPSCSFDYNLEWDTSGGSRYGRLSYSSGPIDFSSWKAANPAGTDAHSLNVNPNLANPSAGNFQETSTSHTISAGLTISGITGDFAGLNRTNPPDIGAYNFAHPTVPPFVGQSSINLAPIKYDTLGTAFFAIATYPVRLAYNLDTQIAARSSNGTGRRSL